MKVLRVKDIVRKDAPIYYRMDYSGVAALELPGGEVERRVDFSVETTPSGTREITITHVEPVDYPLVPLMRELKRFISGLAEKGGLPR
ncbi:MAG: hypothetical protein MdMp014T_1301 [Treponematales bacterium]